MWYNNIKREYYAQSVGGMLFKVPSVKRESGANPERLTVAVCAAVRYIRRRESVIGKPRRQGMTTGAVCFKAV